MSRKLVFVILHYCAIQSTIESIESVRNFFSDDIIVVDNGSPDQSGQQLTDKYQHISTVHIILNEHNDGFAKGNNIGYRYAKDILQAEFIVVMNNDVLMIQSDFTQKVKSIYDQNRYDVLGPDIITPAGEHRNPHRLQTFTKKELNRIIRNRTIILWYLRIKRFLGINDKIRFIENWDTQRSIAERSNIDRKQIQKNVVLQGSCFIFSPDFLKKESEAFCPDTFMWMEEEILTYLCQIKDYEIRYDPVIKVIHKEEVSTKESGSENTRYYFFSQQLRKSAIVMRQIMIQHNRKI